jgi:predicted nucleotidyltransferase component of viral defense system
MLAPFNCQTSADYENALKEIIQEIALLGLWRAKFFESAAFYGGSALRIVYEIDRFSEDLDFSLLRSDPTFKLERFLSAIEQELGAFGFSMTVEAKTKSIESPIQPAFIKANTRSNLLVVETPEGIIRGRHRNERLKIKLEIDVDPPGDFRTEARTRLLPIPFGILTYQLPDLFAGKISAALLRQRSHYVKGRDWYDLVWLIARSIPVRLSHCKARLVQAGAWKSDEELTAPRLVSQLTERIESLDIEAARADVVRFVKDPASLELWSRPFFHEVVARLQVV